MKTYKITLDNGNSVKVTAEDILQAIINTLATFDFIKVEQIVNVKETLNY